MDFSRRVVLAANSDEHRSFCDPQQNDAIASARAASTALSTISTTSKTSSIDSINTHKTGTKSVVCVAKCLSFSPDRRSFAAATRWCRANWTRSSSTSSELVYRSALMRRCAQTTRAAGRRLRLALLRLPPSDSDAAWLRFASMSSVAHRRRRCERAAASTHAHRRDWRSARILDCSLRLLRARRNSRRRSSSCASPSLSRVCIPSPGIALFVVRLILSDDMTSFFLVRQVLSDVPSRPLACWAMTGASQRALALTLCSLVAATDGRLSLFDVTTASRTPSTVAAVHCRA